MVGATVDVSPPTPSGRRFWGLWVLSLVVYVATLLYGLSVWGVRGKVPVILVMLIVPLIWTSMTWFGRRGPTDVLPRPGPLLVGTYALVWVLAVAGVLVTGYSLADGLRSATGIVLQTVLGQLLYRSMRKILVWWGVDEARRVEDQTEVTAGWQPRWRREWAPTSPMEVVALVVAALVAAAPGHVAEVRRLIFDHLTPEEVAQLGAVTAKILPALSG